MAKGKKTKKAPAKKSPAKKKPVLKKTAAKKPKKTAMKKTASQKKPMKQSGPKAVVQKTTSKPISAAKSSRAQQKVNWSEFVTPLDDRLIVQLNNQERKTAGGLYIPDTASDVSGNKQGVAVSVGRGHLEANGKIRPMDVRVGDQVVFAEYAGSKIELLGETLVLLRESEVMGILTS